ncbi:hypothetical protein [Cellulomonas sp. NPDC089187]|uniref:hypothetical protein n=1 Tax=Cellulomonas sp. NPDC089187 TaxID=3154970 RepID=UPI003416A00D
MGAYVVGIVLALLAAGAVIVLAVRGSDERTTWRTFLADFQAGWRGLRGKQEPEPEPVDVRFDELFEAEAEPGDDYLHLDEFAELIERTGDRAGQLWHHDRDGARGGLSEGERGPWIVHPRGHRGGPGRTSGGRPARPARPSADDASEDGSPRRTSVSVPR